MVVHDRRVLKSLLFTQECHRFVHNTHKYINHEVFFKYVRAKTQNQQLQQRKKNIVYSVDITQVSKKKKFKKRIQRGCPLCSVMFLRVFLDSYTILIYSFRYNYLVMIIKPFNNFKATRLTGAKKQQSTTASIAMILNHVFYNLNQRFFLLFK